jgi:predicted DNA-binding transcriptional regulator YafY
MPVNKAARIRYEIIDECLRNGMQKWTRKMLLQKVNEKLLAEYNVAGISPSMLRKDMEAMQSIYGAPIEGKQEGKDVYYFYEDSSFSIQDLPLEEEDLLRLNEAVHLLKQIKAFTLSENIAEVVQKLEKRARLKGGNHSVIFFDNPPAPKGIELLEDIYMAILNRHVLKINYQSFKQAVPHERLIHPYFLKEYNNRWFLLGLVEETKTIGTYALDRVHSVKVSSNKYEENILLNAVDYFENIIGVTLPANTAIENVLLEFSAPRAPYVITKPLHHSQQQTQRNENGSIVIQIQVIPNPELESLILSFGCDVKVLRPESLKNKLSLIVGRMVKCYGE